MNTSAIIQSGQISLYNLRKKMSQKHRIYMDTDPALAADFHNIDNVFSLLLHDSAESSQRNNPQRSFINSEKDEIIQVMRTPSPISNDGYWKKYGSKSIRNSVHRRGYYRCGYENCKAKKQLQKIQQNHATSSLFQTTYINRHTCNAKDADNDTHGSKTMIQFDNHVSSEFDCDIPPLVSDNHQEPIIHAPLPVAVPARDDVHVSCLNSRDMVSDMKAEDEPSLNPTIPADDMNDDDEDLLNFYEPVLSPSLDIRTFLGDDFNLNF